MGITEVFVTGFFLFFFGLFALGRLVLVGLLTRTSMPLHSTPISTSKAARTKIDSLLHMIEMSIQIAYLTGSEPAPRVGTWIVKSSSTSSEILFR